MYFKVGEIRPFVLINVIHYGKILEVNIEDETYTIQDLETERVYTVDSDDVFIGDDWNYEY